MKLSTQIKQFFAKMGLKVRVRTGTGKGRWLSAWIPCDNSPENRHKLVYTQPPFPLDLRVACLKLVYPDSPTCWSGNAGNVRSYDIALHDTEWQTILATYTRPQAVDVTERHFEPAH
jgi:hypothetical protein